MPGLYNLILGIAVRPACSTLCTDSVSLSVLLSSPSLTTSMAAQLSSMTTSYLTSGTVVHTWHSAQCAQCLSSSAVSSMWSLC